MITCKTVDSLFTLSKKSIKNWKVSLDIYNYLSYKEKIIMSLFFLKHLLFYF